MFKRLIALKGRDFALWHFLPRVTVKRRFGSSSSRCLAIAFFCVLIIAYVLGYGLGKSVSQEIHSDASDLGGVQVGLRRSVKTSKVKSQAPLGYGIQGIGDENKIRQSNGLPLASPEETTLSIPIPPWTRTSAKRSAFDKALQKVISLLPDEVYRSKLLRPITTGGAERMREIGIRTRIYRTYFEAWENLHLVEDEAGNMFVRDDVIQSLYAREGLLNLAAGVPSNGIQDTSSNREDDKEVLRKSQQLAQTIRTYETFRSFLKEFADFLFPWTTPYFANHMTLHAQFKRHGRGIVLTAGNDQAPWLLTTIYSFRQLGCTLPIEVVYHGELDLGKDYRSDLEALPGVITRDISTMINDSGWELTGWAVKPFAILLSSFREVIFIDADALFFRNPALLFDDPDYQRTGALFFRDRNAPVDSKQDFLKTIMPHPVPKLAKQSSWWTGESIYMQESGVVVVDKWKHFIAMMLVCRLNGSDRNTKDGVEGVYSLMFGDKETFWLGFLLSGDESYAFHSGETGVLGVVESNILKKDSGDSGNRGAPRYDDNSLTGAENQKKRGEWEKNIEEEKKETVIVIKMDSKGHALATICASQLLHLDLDGRPLWFNNWLLEDKYADRAEQRFLVAESFLADARLLPEKGDGDFWSIATANMACLTAEEKRVGKLTEKEKRIFDMMVRRTKEVAGYKIGKN
ncbi:mannosyltransferase putative-domain-containing protein [Camillea tinctor]|nr:mannosyltransferase putative-domain-containing protein [Camillea tinctor]